MFPWRMTSVHVLWYMCVLRLHQCVSLTLHVCVVAIAEIKRKKEKVTLKNWKNLEVDSVIKSALWNIIKAYCRAFYMHAHTQALLHHTYCIAVQIFLQVSLCMCGVHASVSPSVWCQGLCCWWGFSIHVGWIIPTQLATCCAHQVVKVTLCRSNWQGEAPHGD